VAEISMVTRVSSGSRLSSATRTFLTNTPSTLVRAAALEATFGKSSMRRRGCSSDSVSEAGFRRPLPASVIVVEVRVCEARTLCSSVATAVGPACRVDAREAVTYAGDTCNGPTATSVFELGAPVADQTSVYTAWPDSTCHLYNSGASSPIVNPLLATYEIGAPVPLSAFADTQEVHTGTGQIHHST